MRAIAVIPARYASTRLPGKPLLTDTGKYLIQHVCERVIQAETIDQVIVATDDQRIADAVSSFGGTSAMTRSDHPSGTDRVAEVAATLDCDLIINVQGDEPEIEPASLDALVRLMIDDQDVSVATLACPFARLDKADPSDPNAVKVIIDNQSHAIYFSRAMIPYPRSTETGGHLHLPAPYLLHLGVYAYRRQVLPKLASLPQTPLEKTEKLEQLRWIEHGHKIAVAIVPQAAVGIDTPEDYAAFVERYQSE